MVQPICRGTTQLSRPNSPSECPLLTTCTPLAPPWPSSRLAVLYALPSAIDAGTSRTTRNSLWSWTPTAASMMAESTTRKSQGNSPPNVARSHCWLACWATRTDVSLAPVLVHAWLRCAFFSMIHAQHGSEEPRDHRTMRRRSAPAGLPAMLLSLHRLRLLAARKPAAALHARGGAASQCRRRRYVAPRSTIPIETPRLKWERGSPQHLIVSTNG